MHMMAAAAWLTTAAAASCDHGHSGPPPSPPSRPLPLRRPPASQRTFHSAEVERQLEAMLNRSWLVRTTLTLTLALTTLPAAGSCAPPALRTARHRSAATRTHTVATPDPHPHTHHTRVHTHAHARAAHPTLTLTLALTLTRTPSCARFSTTACPIRWTRPCGKRPPVMTLH